MDVLNNDVLMKKLNESTISIHTVEIQSTCEVHQVLEKLSLPSCLKVLRIRENSLNFEDNVDLLRYLRRLSNLHELDLCRTKFNERTFCIFISALNYCKDLTSLILTDNSLTEQEINGLITVFELVKNLKILNLSQCILTETQANTILHKQEQAKNIVSLNLSHNAIQGNEIIAGICQLQSLQELDLSHNSVRFSPLPNLEGKRDHLSTCTKVISLSSNHMKPDDIFQFCSLITSNLSKLNLDFNHVGHSIWSFCSLGEKIKHLKELSLANTDICHNVDGLVFLLSLVRELEDLNLSCNNLLAEDFQQLQTHLSKLTQLKTLNLSMNVIGPDGMKGICQLQSLKELDLSHNCVRFSPLPNFKGKFKHLKKISLSSSHMKPDDISQFCSLITSNLLELNLNCNHIGHSIWSIWSLGEKIRHLKVLSLANTDICNNVDGLAFLLSLVLELEDLNLSCNNLLAEDFQQLQTHLSKLTLLKTLNLSMNAVGPDGMKALADIFKEFQLLERLDMSSSFIREHEVRVLCKNLVSLKKLKCLNLSGNFIHIEVLEDALVLPVTLEELLFSDVIHGEKLFDEMGQLQNLRKLHLNKLKLRVCDAEALALMLRSFLKLEELSLASLVAPECETILIAIKSLKNIRKIDLTGIKFINVEALVDMLSSLLFLEELVLTGMRATNVDYQSLFSVMKLLKRLRLLSLYVEGEIYGAKAFFEMFSSLSILEDIAFPLFDFEEIYCIPGCFGSLESLGYLRSLDLDLSTISESTAGVLACVLPSLQMLEKLELNLCLVDDVQRDLFAALGKLKNLKELIIEDAELESINSLADVLPSLQLLEKFDLNISEWDSFDGNECCKRLFDALGTLRYLKEFSYSRGIKNADIEAFAHALSSLPLLETLRFYTCNLSNGGYVRLYDAISKLEYLRKLELFIEHDNNEAETLAMVLPSLELLEELTLDLWKVNRLDSEHEKQMFAAIGKSRYLKKLCYHCPSKSCTNVAAFCEMLTSLRLLETLELYSFKSKNESEKKELFIAVGKLKHLKTLHFFSGTKITRTNVKALARALPSLQILENLELTDIYDINKCQCEELLAAVGKLKYLKRLDLNWRKMTETNVDALVRALASLQVLEELTLHVNFYCNHECEDDCNDECDHECSRDCHHSCYEGKCRDECGHDCYDDSCHKCRCDEKKKHDDLVKTKVLDALKKLKYFNKCYINGYDGGYCTVYT